jgi:thiosulfate/3-mercaptopyruvate sulfurtransferase
MNKALLLLLLGGLSTLSIARAEIPQPLVDTQWLAENQASVIILDARKETGTFADGHISGAILVDVTTIRVERKINSKTLINMRPDAAGFQRFMRAHGINNDSVVVITHPGDKTGQVAGAARLYWHFKYYGFDQVALLDGGNRAWTTELEDLVTDVEPIVAGDYQVGSERPELLATMEQVQQALADDAITLVDTRDFRYHIGLEKKDYVFAYGHIPGSRTLPYKFLNPAKGSTRYLDHDTLVKLLDSLRIDMDDSLIMYCNSAYECASDWFVLHEILGKQDVRVYDGSLHQWTQYESNPMTTRLSD